MLYMVIEHVRDGDPVPVYRRLRDEGRMLPSGLEYVGSWVSEELVRCYQVIECDDRGLLDAWMARWADLADFDVIPVVGSADAAAAVADRL
jgi:Domain of unknown function (DUF3303)